MLLSIYFAATCVFLTRCSNAGAGLLPTLVCKGSN